MGPSTATQVICILQKTLPDSNNKQNTVKEKKVEGHLTDVCPETDWFLVYVAVTCYAVQAFNMGRLMETVGI